jgi:branched-chain amino acid transport system substrate-binding protein
MLRTCFAIVGTLAFAAAAHGQPTILPGITAKEIRIGNTMPYSGPASSLGLVGRVMAAYFQMVNDQGGVNGRQISFITLDDGFSPSKTVEQTRRLVENDNVALFTVPWERHQVRPFRNI